MSETIRKYFELCYISIASHEDELKEEEEKLIKYLVGELNHFLINASIRIALLIIKKRNRKPQPHITFQIRGSVTNID